MAEEKIRIVREGGAGEGNISELLPPRGHRGLDVVPRNRSGMSRLELIVLHSKNADGCNARRAASVSSDLANEYRV